MQEKIIAGSPREASEFRAQEGLKASAMVWSRRGLTGSRPAKVHVLPEFFRRRDIPAWRAELRSLLRNSPKTQILIWAYGDAGFVHDRDARMDPRGNFQFMEAGATAPVPRERKDPNPAAAPSTGDAATAEPGAVPGETADPAGGPSKAQAPDQGAATPESPAAAPDEGGSPDAPDPQSDPTAAGGDPAKNDSPESQGETPADKPEPPKPAKKSTQSKKAKPVTAEEIFGGVG